MLLMQWGCVEEMVLALLQLIGAAVGLRNSAPALPWGASSSGMSSRLMMQVRRCGITFCFAFAAVRTLCGVGLCRRAAFVCCKGTSQRRGERAVFGVWLVATGAHSSVEGCSFFWG